MKIDTLCGSSGEQEMANSTYPPFPVRKVDKLRKDNDNLKKGNESLRRERQYEKQKALTTYEASGMSYHALNQTVKALSLSKQKLTAEVRVDTIIFKCQYFLLCACLFARFCCC